ncbi:MAG TPA: hypothetical protein DHV59_01575 [Oxalobacteraceae bacterium]|nr:hypothetical protein [Oxalobacteraceae bacterium]
MGTQPQSGAKPPRPNKFRPARHGLDEPPQHFTGQLTLENIYGEWWASARDGFFTVRWKRFFAYLHQFDPASRAQLIAACETAHRRRDHPHGLPGWEG